METNVLSEELPSTRRFGPTAQVVVTEEAASVWVGKAQALAAAALGLAGDVADPAEVTPVVVKDKTQWAYGNFMLAWLDSEEEVRHVRHLPDASFFLRLLGLAYAPVLERRADLAELLLDHSRPEVSLTNDVLQIQLKSPIEGYSMVRNHALMLFFATLWLEEPRRSQWFDLYDELLTHVDHRPGGRPGLTELKTAEEGAFADFVALAPLSTDAADAERLLEDESQLRRILDYQLYAGAAIGLLWRSYQAAPEGSREAWQHTQLADRYIQLDYLNDEWTDWS